MTVVQGRCPLAVVLVLSCCVLVSGCGGSKHLSSGVGVRTGSSARDVTKVDTKLAALALRTSPSDSGPELRSDDPAGAARHSDRSATQIAAGRRRLIALAERERRATIRLGAKRFRGPMHERLSYEPRRAAALTWRALAVERRARLTERTAIAHAKKLAAAAVASNPSRCLAKAGVFAPFAAGRSRSKAASGRVREAARRCMAESRRAARTAGGS